MITFETIRAQAEAHDGDAPAGMFQYTMAAAQNADFTIHAEKEAPESEYENIAMASLECILCFPFIEETDEVARAYFTALGVRF